MIVSQKCSDAVNHNKNVKELHNGGANRWKAFDTIIRLTGPATGMENTIPAVSPAINKVRIISNMYITLIQKNLLSRDSSPFEE